MTSINYEDAVALALKDVARALAIYEDFGRHNSPEENADIRADIANTLARAQVYATLAIARRP